MSLIRCKLKSEHIRSQHRLSTNRIIQLNTQTSRIGRDEWKIAEKNTIALIESINLLVILYRWSYHLYCCIELNYPKFTLNSLGYTRYATQTQFDNVSVEGFLLHFAAFISMASARDIESHSFTSTVDCHECSVDRVWNIFLLLLPKSQKKYREKPLCHCLFTIFVLVEQRISGWCSQFNRRSICVTENIRYWWSCASCEVTQCTYSVQRILVHTFEWRIRISYWLFLFVVVVVVGETNSRSIQLHNWNERKREEEKYEKTEIFSFFSRL